MKHNESKDHKHAVQADLMRKQLYGTVPTTTETESEEQIIITESEHHLFRTTYFVAKQNLPNNFVNTQLDFLRLSGVDTEMKDLHSDTIISVQKSLIHVLDEEMKSELKSAKYYGIITDESTDLSIHKKLIIYIRYVCKTTGDLKTQLVGDLRIADGTAQTIAVEICNKVKYLGLNMANLVGFGSDGASVMFGRKNGVGQLLRKDAPLLTHVHCMAHRLALACSDASKEIPYLKHYRDTLKNLYVHVSGSGIRTYKLEAMQEIMEEPQLKLKDPINIRWLAMENAVTTVHKCYGAIVAYLQSNEGKNTVGDNVAEGLLKDILHYKFPAFTAVLSDVLSVVGVLSKQLQADSLDVSQLDVLSESALGRLNGLKNVAGTRLTEFQENVSATGSKLYFKGIQLTHANEKSQMEKLKNEYIDSVCHHLEQRLSNESNSVLKSFSVLEPQSLDLLTKSERSENLKNLAKFYNISEAELEREFSGLETLMSGSYKQLSLKEFHKVLLRRHQEEYPLTVMLVTIAMCIPVTSVACERGFSLQNRIKIKGRTSLTPDNLETLMKLSSGPCVKDFPYEKAIRHWRLEKKRRLTRLYQPSK